MGSEYYLTEPFSFDPLIRAILSYGDENKYKIVKEFGPSIIAFPPSKRHSRKPSSYLLILLDVTFSFDPIIVTFLK